jgi:hypothetical protein
VNRTLRYHVGDWVEVTVQREGAPLVLRGKVTRADRDGATATCRTSTGDQSFDWSADTEGHIIFRRLTAADWSRSRRRA